MKSINNPTHAARQTIVRMLAAVAITTASLISAPTHATAMNSDHYRADSRQSAMPHLTKQYQNHLVPAAFSIGYSFRGHGSRHQPYVHFKKRLGHSKRHHRSGNNRSHFGKRYRYYGKRHRHHGKHNRFNQHRYRY